MSSSTESKLAQNILWWKDSSLNEGRCPLLKEDNNKIVEIHLLSWKSFFFRTNRPNSTKLGTKHGWRELKILYIRTIQISKKKIIRFLLLLINVMILWYCDIFHSFAQMCILIWTGFSGERCGPCARFYKYRLFDYGLWKIQIMKL